MVVHYGDFFRAGVRPAKDNAPLVVDANRVIAFQSTRQGLQAITRRHCQVGKLSGAIHLNELTQGDAGYGTKATTSLMLEKLPGIVIREGLNHRGC